MALGTRFAASRSCSYSLRDRVKKRTERRVGLTWVCRGNSESVLVSSARQHAQQLEDEGGRT